MNQNLRTLRASFVGNPKRLIYPEGDDETIIRAAAELASDGSIVPTLVSSGGDTEKTLERLGLEASRIKFVDSDEEDRLVYACQLLKTDEYDGMVAGIRYTTRDVVRACLKNLGLAADTSLASSLFVMDIPNYDGGQGGLLIYADAGLNIAPDAEALAVIAEQTADSAAAIGWQPRLAFLSYSTKGSASGDSVDKIHAAMEIISRKRPDLLIDGEMQLDAALDSTVAERKSMNDSPVAGKANVLIFPDLDSGNIAYKLTERLAGAHAYGPILQGFPKSISDLSRGSSLEDVIGTSIMVAARAQSKTH